MTLPRSCLRSLAEPNYPIAIAASTRIHQIMPDLRCHVILTEGRWSSKKRNPGFMKRHQGDNGDVWETRRRARSGAIATRNYIVFAAPGMEKFAQRMEDTHSSRFHYLPIEWSKFNDGTDKIKMTGFSPINQV